MSILPGFQKYKRHIRIGEDYILDSEWTHAETVEMSDGSTLDDTVANINREITATKKSVSDGKSTVANAITAQGVTTAADATFDTMAANVTAAGNARYNAGVAATKVGNAAAANVLSGKTFTNASAVGLTGTMADYSADPQTVTLSSTQTGTSTLSLSAGYHSSVKVNAASVYNAGVTAGKQQTSVKTGYVDVTTSNGSTWYYFTINTGLSKVNDFLASACLFGNNGILASRPVSGADREGGAGCAINQFNTSPSNGRVEIMIFMSSGTYRISWIAAGEQ